MSIQQRQQINLRIPGPTPVPDDILEAVGRPMINHRGREFAGIITRTAERLKDFFVTGQDVMLLSCSGTGGLEAAVVNMLSPGDKVLAVSIGAFGDRFATIAETYGANVIPLSYEWGQAAKAGRRPPRAEEHPDVKAVLVTHNETSTGVTNPLAEIARCGARVRGQQAAARGRGEQPGRDTAGDGRVGAGRGGDGVAEGVDGAAGARVRLDERARLEGVRELDDAALLLRPRQAPGLAGEGPDAVDADDVGVLRARHRARADDAGGDGGDHHAPRARWAR